MLWRHDASRLAFCGAPPPARTRSRARTPTTSGGIGSSSPAGSGTATAPATPAAGGATPSRTSTARRRWARTPTGSRSSGAGSSRARASSTYTRSSATATMLQGAARARHHADGHAAPLHQPALAGGAGRLAAPGHAAALRPLRRARRRRAGRPVRALVYDQRADGLCDAELPAGHLAARRDRYRQGHARRRGAAARARRRRRGHSPRQPGAANRHGPPAAPVRPGHPGRARCRRRRQLGLPVQRDHAARAAHRAGAAAARQRAGVAGAARLVRFLRAELLHARARGLRPAGAPGCCSAGAIPRPMCRRARSASRARPTARSTQPASTARCAVSRACACRSTSPRPACPTPTTTSARASSSSHLAAAHRAIQDGVDLRGVFFWTLVDNFEWTEGWGLRFGLYALDQHTGARRLRPSGALYAAIARANAIPEESIPFK